MFKMQIEHHRYQMDYAYDKEMRLVMLSHGEQIPLH